MGFVPESFSLALLMLIVSMIGWSSWSVSFKKTKGWRFEFWYIMFMVGLITSILFLNLTLGMIGSPTFLESLYEANAKSIANGLIAGVIWNIGNFLIVVAIALVGFGFAFPIIVGLAIVLGSLLSYFVNPLGNFLFFILGIALLVIGVVSDSLAYRFRDTSRGKTPESKNLKKGLLVTFISAILIGFFPYFYSNAFTPVGNLTPYTGNFFFSLGAFIPFPLIFIAIKKPLTGEKSVSIREFFNAKKSFYLWGFLGGLIWSVATVFNFAAASVVGFAISFAVGNSAAMVGAMWGIFVFKELEGAPRKSWLLISLMFTSFILGVVSLSLAYVYA